MKTAPNMHVEWVEDEAVVLNLETKELHYLNATAALVYALVAEHGYKTGLEHLEQLVNGGEDAKLEIDQIIELMQSRGLLVDD